MQRYFLSLGMTSVSSHGKVQWYLPTSHPPLPVCSSCHTDYPLGCPLLGFGALNSPNFIPLSNYPSVLLSKVVLLLEFPLHLHPEKSKTCTLALSFFSNLTCTFSWQLDLFTSVIHQHLKLNLSKSLLPLPLWFLISVVH